MRALTLSMALVEQITRRFSGSNARNGTNSGQVVSRNRTIAGYRAPQVSANSAHRSRAAASAGAVQTGLRALAIASQC
ncbi:hypothetical protein SAMN05421854_106422 [Amycolatopsis rubida]|uniref:Uncharacterized protein n=1 Tax=Amycolatopsis rubida TaxID=112413 RepID=A0A1I5SR64_9PSEU|nr:hypothetical protein SAMN05421854_106422 [Amycolatopsis rubida]